MEKIKLDDEQFLKLIKALNRLGDAVEQLLKEWQATEERYSEANGYDDWGNPIKYGDR